MVPLVASAVVTVPEWVAPIRFFAGLLGAGVAGALSLDWSHGRGDRTSALRGGLYASVGGLVLHHAAAAVVVFVPRLLFERRLPTLSGLVVVSNVVSVVGLLPIYLVSGVVAGWLGNALRHIGVRSLPRAVVGAVRRGPITPSVDDRPSRSSRSAVPTAEFDALCARTRRDPTTEGVEALIGCLDAPDRERRHEAAATIAAVPRAHFDGTAGALRTLLDRLADDDRLDARRDAIGAVARIARERPAAVEPAVPELTAFFGAYNVRVRESAAAAVRAVTTEFPACTPALFPLLAARSATARSTTLSVLASVAETSPGAVRPAVPRLLDLADDEEIDRAPLVEVLAAVAGEYPAAVAPAADRLIEWLPSDPADPADPAGDNEEPRDGTMQGSLIRALARIAAADPAAVEHAVPALVAHLTAAARSDRREVARALVRIAADCPEGRDAIASECRAHDEWSRLAVAGAIDEATPSGDATGLIGAVLAEGDSYRDHLLADRPSASSAPTLDRESG